MPKCPYNYAVFEELQSAIREVLVKRAQPERGWCYSTRTRQAATEPTALAVLATGLAPTPLKRTQNSDGSWAAIEAGGSLWPASWSTSLALIALLRSEPTCPAIPKAIQWLCSSRGRESQWLWRWKFKTVDTHVRFNPDKFGWSWAPQTASWVIPTAFAVLALRIAGNRNDRTRLGIEMLLDRACPDGGWNAGNGVAFGVALTPHVEATAIAVLALQGMEAADEGTVNDALGWLIEHTEVCRGISSTAWTIIALQAHRAHSRLLNARLTQLAAMIDLPAGVADNAALAVSVLAIAAANGRNPFKVAA